MLRRLKNRSLLHIGAAVGRFALFSFQLCTRRRYWIVRYVMIHLPLESRNILNKHRSEMVWIH